jgi:hypothetical protein
VLGFRLLRLFGSSLCSTVGLARLFGESPCSIFGWLVILATRCDRISKFLVWAPAGVLSHDFFSILLLSQFTRCRRRHNRRSGELLVSGRPSRNAQTIQFVRLESLIQFLATRCARLSAASSFWRLAVLDCRLGPSFWRSTFEISGVGPCRCAVS